ncbi:MAG TPA: SOS response-associated peptidase [Steroidobacteraceae bacterium]|nr:SOS response-associated peptidase [Steroidobacteraceae bacterium]
MFERYVLPEAEQAEREFGVVRRWWQFAPSFNVAPSRYVPVVRTHEDEVEGVMLRWGLIPEWAEADASKACAATASFATLAHSSVTRGAWDLGRRCIVPMFGFYTWQRTGRGHRQPFFVRLVNRSAFGVAAVWDRTEPEEGDDVIESCALITVPPNPLLVEVQGCNADMPAILERRDYAAWLTGSATKAKSAIKSLPEQHVLAHPVSPRVNSLRNDDAQLIRPVDPAAAAARAAARRLRSK